MKNDNNRFCSFTKRITFRPDMPYIRKIYDFNNRVIIKNAAASKDAKIIGFWPKKP